MGTDIVRPYDGGVPSRLPRGEQRTRQAMMLESSRRVFGEMLRAQEDVARTQLGEMVTAHGYSSARQLYNHIRRDADDPVLWSIGVDLLMGHVEGIVYRQRCANFR